jgi:hypothetical protein
MHSAQERPAVVLGKVIDAAEASFGESLDYLRVMLRG